MWYVLQDAYPLRPKCMHMLNMPGLMDNILTMFKSFMNDKMKDRIQHYPMDDFSAFVEDCGIDVLPEELGGSNGKIQDHIGTWINMSINSNFNLCINEKNTCRLHGQFDWV